MNTASFAPNDLLVSDVPVVTRNIAIAQGQLLDRGAVVGLVTADDNYVLSLAAAENGSEVPALVLAYEVDASDGPKVVAAYSSAAFDATKLVYGAGHDAGSVEQAFRTAGTQLYVRTLK